MGESVVKNYFTNNVQDEGWDGWSFVVMEDLVLKDGTQESGSPFEILA